MEIKGQLISAITPLSLDFNGMTTVEKVLLFENGNEASLPEPEYQVGVYFDSYGCASFSFNNPLETVANRCLELGLYSPENAKWLKDNYSVNGKINFSDRDLVVLSGTDPDWGNSTDKIFASVLKNGLIPETDAPWEWRSRDASINNKANYYNYKRSAESDKKAKELLKRFDITGEWVARGSWLEASKYGAIQVYTRAWHRLANGLYYNPVPNSSGHGIMLVKKENRSIFDQYDPFIKLMERDEDFYPVGFKLNLIEKIMTKPILANNTLVQEVTTSGQFGMFLDGKIFIDDLAKIIATYYMRNNGNTIGKTRALTADQWAMFEKVDLSGRKV